MENIPVARGGGGRGGAGYIIHEYRGREEASLGRFGIKGRVACSALEEGDQFMSSCQLHAF